MNYLIGTFLTLLGFSVQAAVPVTVTTALTDASADAVTVAGLALAIVIAIYGFKAMKRSL